MEIKRAMKALVGAILAGVIFFIILPYIFIRAGIFIGLTPNFTYGRAIIGTFLIIIGIAVSFYCSYLFIKEGKGTPAPFEPASHLVSSRIYQYTRNPMYMAYMSIIFGEILLTGALILIAYAIIIFSFISWYVIFIEEPKLEKRFGKLYMDYKRKVPRWI